MKNVSCVVYFDLLGDFDAEKKVCEDCWKVWSRGHPGIAGQIKWTFTDDPERLCELIPGADFVFFDYGGLSTAGHESLGSSFAREIERHIIERPSVEFILLCTMGKHWYEDDYQAEHVNLHFEEQHWSGLFDKYIGDMNYAGHF
jgi:hypothetical protein